MPERPQGDVMPQALSGCLFENDDWLVVDKPTGVSTHGAFPGDVALQEWIQLHWDKTTHVCSRLDKGTSGVLIFAKTAAASARAQRVHEALSSQKEYVFLSHARLLESEFQSNEPLDGALCETRFRFLQAVGNAFLYAATIQRGRMHQIRRHASKAGIPVLGDVDYGGKPAERLFLHCHKTRWPEIEAMLESPLPESFLVTNLLQRAVSVALERRGKLLSGICNAFRCVHRGEIPVDCAIDRYANCLCVWDYESEKSEEEVVNQIAPVAEVICERLKVSGWVLKRSVRNPHTRKLVASQRVFGEAPPPWFDVHEHGFKFRVTLTEAQHVGLFLDQRDNRRFLFKNVLAKRVANLFSYTCSFSVFAAAGEAEVVFSVDVAKKYLDVGVANFELNSLSERRSGKFVAEDVRSWLARQDRKRDREGEKALFDAIVCDPPTYSSTATQGEFSVAEEWEHLARQCARILRPSGFVLFSNNHRAGERSNYEDVLKRYFARVERRSQPLDFPQMIKEPDHVKLFLCFEPRGVV
jgi:23S rRNA G2069 N7-methylase RlmK/C1962 C5-methylase RlmI